MEEMTFEQKFKRLNEINSLLQNGEATMDERLKVFEEGIALSRELAKQLKNYEDKIAQLTGEEQ